MITRAYLALSLAVLSGGCGLGRYVVPDTVAEATDSVGTWREIAAPIEGQTDAGLYLRGHALFVTGSSFFVSVDRGATFHRIDPSFPYGILAPHGRRLYGGYFGAGVGYSDDDGWTFRTRPPTTYSGEAFDSHLISTGAPESVRALRLLGDTLYAACDDGLYTSGLSRLAWTRLDVCGRACGVRDIALHRGTPVASTELGLFVEDGPGAFRAVQAVDGSGTIHPQSLVSNGDVVCAAWHPLGITCASGDLSTWVTTRDGFPRSDQSEDIPHINAFDLVGDVLYVATNAGLFTASTLGAPVSRVEALEQRRVVALAHDEAHLYVWASTPDGRGHLYRHRYR